METSPRIQPAVQGAPQPPKLVVEVVIDQFPEYFLTGSKSFGIESYEALMGGKGFQRLMKEGAYFNNASYTHAFTLTAPDHATVATGAPPCVHGVPNNDWFSRTEGLHVFSVGDKNFELLGGTPKETGVSPKRLRAETLAGALLRGSPQSKAVIVAGKDRSAVLSAGSKPAQSYWYDTNTGNFVTSTYYTMALPDWVKEFNAKKFTDKYYGTTWERLLPETVYQGRDDVAWENNPKLPWAIFGEPGSARHVFPYTIGAGAEKPGKSFYAEFEFTPFANELLVSFAESAIDGEHLGQDDHPDLLVIGLSPHDTLGHAFGPTSHETQDMIARTDRLLEKLMADLDAKIGRGQWTLCLTADHGVGLVPEDAQSRGVAGGRVEATAVAAAVQEALNKRFGEDKWIIEFQRRSTPLQFINGNLFLNPETMQRHQLKPADVEIAASEAIARVPGIYAAYPRSEILKGDVKDDVGKRVAESYVADQNGDVMVIAKSGFIVAESLAASHGTPWPYDACVPILFYGKGVARGVSSESCSPMDIAPTLAKLMGVEPPKQNQGHVLSKALTP